jgi:hypothetical protein
MKIPTLRLKPSNSIEDVADGIEEADVFYRRIVQYIMNRLEGVETNNVLCHIIDEYNNKRSFILENTGDNWSKALGKALEYFESLEEYETCDLIKQLKQNI